MWLFTNTAFVSAVQHREDPRVIVVRARLKGDLKKFFGKKMLVIETPVADYRWRCYVSRATLKQAMIRALDGIDYSNFKNSVPDHAHHEAYMGVWSVMHSAQQDELNPPKRRERTLFSLLDESKYEKAPYDFRLPPIDVIMRSNAGSMASDEEESDKYIARENRERMAVEIENVALSYGYALDSCVDALIEEGHLVEN